VHSLDWEEAQMLSGMDPDFHRRDLYDAIEAGAFPEWELGIQVFPDNPEETFAGIDLLDPTKIVPEELAEVQAVGKLVLNRTPTNFFAETEQVAFHLGHLPPGIDVTNDPLLQGRLFSYVDTQLTRLAGPNFSQIPINRPHAPVNDMLRDGFHQQAVHAGVAPYRPNSLDGGNPFTAGDAENAFLDVPVTVAEAPKVRANPASFDDHFSQVRLFWLSMTPVEKEHIIRAYTFELGKCYEQAIKERQLRCLADIDPVLCEQVATGLGLPAPEPTRALADETPSPALSQIGRTWPSDGRVIGIVVDPDSGLDGVDEVRRAVFAAGMVPLLIGPHGGMVGDLPVQRTFATGRSVEFDAILLAGAPAPAPDALPARDAKAGAASAAGAAAVDPRVQLLVDECWRHAKAIGAWGDGVTVLQQSAVAGTPGVVTADSGPDAFTAVQELLGAHRVWERFPASVA
jgi:catalase